jgi:predicted anti-sigma-YlaC factor YlaD
MNCELCQKELDAYLEGRLPEGTRAQVKEHLKSCNGCAEIYNVLILAERVIGEEKGIQSNPYLSTRIMAGIEKLEQKQENFQLLPVYNRALKPLLITVSIAAAVLIGFLAGSIYKPMYTDNKIPVELTYINDASLESIELIANE